MGGEGEIPSAWELLGQGEREQGWPGRPNKLLHHSFPLFPVLVVKAAGREPVLEARCHGGVMMDNRRKTAEVLGRCFHCN